LYPTEVFNHFRFYLLVIIQWSCQCLRRSYVKHCDDAK